jgi:hypothetical protein
MVSYPNIVFSGHPVSIDYRHQFSPIYVSNMQAETTAEAKIISVAKTPRPAGTQFAGLKSMATKEPTRYPNKTIPKIEYKVIIILDFISLSM